MGYMNSTDTNHYKERRNTSVQWCVPLVGTEIHRHGLLNNSSIEKHMKDRRLSLVSPQLPLLLSYYRIRQLTNCTCLC